MNTKHGINDRIARKPGWKHASLFILVATLALGFAVPSAQAGTVNLNGMRVNSGSSALRTINDPVTMAIIRVPVKLHHFPSATYQVLCDIRYRQPFNGVLGAYLGKGESGGATVPASGHVDTIVPVKIHPMTKKDRNIDRRYWKWICHLIINQAYAISLKPQPGTKFRSTVQGRF